MVRLGKFKNECIRVLRITKKPDKEEFSAIVKVSALGIAVIGVIGFVIIMLAQVIRG